MKKQITFAGGCFWGVEKYFSLIEGVLYTEAGYANGRTPHPTYEDVCTRNTGYAEAVKVLYESDKLPLEFLLQMLYKIIDPTSLNRQGNDVGSQYRTGIYYSDEADLPVIKASLQELQTHYKRRLAVEVKPLDNFYTAEEYHQKYLDKNPGGYCHIPAMAFEEAKNAKPPPRYGRKTDEELKQQLNDLQYAVTRENGTEPPFRNQYNNHFKRGIYVDITNGQPLFVSADKFESGCGWPAFSKPIDEDLVTQLRDTTHGMIRTEVRSRAGDAHLGHVFPDGPAEKGGMRYCINSASLRFIPEEEMEKQGYGEYLPLL